VEEGACLWRRCCCACARRATCAHSRAASSALLPRGVQLRAPAARLVQALGDEVCGEVGLKQRLVLKGVVQLWVREV
jgi:hypothetical protein